MPESPGQGKATPRRPTSSAGPSVPLGGFHGREPRFSEARPMDSVKLAPMDVDEHAHVPLKLGRRRAGTLRAGPLRRVAHGVLPAVGRGARASRAKRPNTSRPIRRDADASRRARSASVAGDEPPRATSSGNACAI